jgi:predicted kinase
MLNRDILVNWFMKNFPEYYSAMYDSQHYADRFIPNIYHGEGSVWTHTMMVMTWIEARHSVMNGDYEVQKDDDYTILITTGMLHDLGKPDCEETMEANATKPLRNSFSGHEGLSVSYSIKVLKKLKEDFPEYYSDDVIELILKVVGTHGVSVQGPAENRFGMLRNKFRIADKKGAVRASDEGLFSQYPDRKFAKSNDIDPNKEVVFMIGMPCVGKSTYIEENFITSHGIVSRDNELIGYYAKHHAMLASDVDYNKAYTWIHDDKFRKSDFEKEFQNYANKLHRYHDKIVIDMTMMPMSSRRKMMNKFPNHTRKAVVMWSDIDTILERNSIRGQQGKYIRPFIFENMAKSFVYPVIEEGFVDIKLVIN